MKEIYADFNSFTSDGTLDLRIPGSVESMQNLSEPLVDGEEVWFSDGEVRVKGFVHKLENGTWEGRSDEWKFEK